MNGREPVTQETMRKAYGIASHYFAAGMDRDDLAQEALIGALQSRRDYRPEHGPFTAFERGCMKRRIFDTINRSRMEKRGGGVWDKPITDEQPSRHTTVEIAEHRAELRRLLRSLRTFTPIERRAVVGFAIGLTYDEIGERKQVDNALARARRKLAA